MMPHDVPFTNPATVSSAVHAPKPPDVAALALAPEHAELPAAYGAQIEIDIEGEIAAFRDRE